MISGNKIENYVREALGSLKDISLSLKSIAKSQQKMAALKDADFKLRYRIHDDKKEEKNS